MATDDEIITTMQLAIDLARKSGIITLSEVASVLFHAIRAAGQQHGDRITAQYVRCASEVYDRIRKQSDFPRGVD